MREKKAPTWKKICNAQNANGYAWWTLEKEIRVRFVESDGNSSEMICGGRKHKQEELTVVLDVAWCNIDVESRLIRIQQECRGWDFP